MEGQRLAEAWMAAVLGPVAGIATGVFKGMAHIGNGRWGRGLEDMAPAALRGPLKAFRYGTEGAVDKSGAAIIEEVGGASVVGQALGLSPSEVRLATEGKAAIFKRDNALGDRRSMLLRQYAMARMAGDQEGVVEVLEAIKGFNEKNPSRRIKPQNMQQSVLNRRKRIEQSQGGVYLPKNRRDAMEAGQFAAQS